MTEFESALEKIIYTMLEDINVDVEENNYNAETVDEAIERIKTLHKTHSDE